MRAISNTRSASFYILFVFIRMLLLLWFIAMCSCATWLMHGLLYWATFVELNIGVLLYNQESQRRDFVASSTFLSSLSFYWFYKLLCITWTSSYTFPLLLYCPCLCHFNIHSANGMIWSTLAILTMCSTAMLCCHSLDAITAISISPT